MTDENTTPGRQPTDRASLVRQHLIVGWWSLLVFLSLGLFLESLHGFKSGFYLDVSNETRRLMWTLAHTHGTLLSVVHLVFAGTLSLIAEWTDRTAKLASRCLISAGLLMPVGFFAGGVHTHQGDPGLGVLLVLPGGVFLLVAVLLTALRVTRPSETD